MNPNNAEELAQALFEEAGDALVIFDPDTEQIQDANPTAQRLSGFERSELLRFKASYLFRSEAQGGLQRLRQAYRKTGLFHSQEGFYLRNRQDGVWTPVNLTITRLHVKPRILGLITARDIHEQRQAHAELKKMEADLRRVLASVSDCLWSADIDSTGEWVYRYISPVIEKLTGHPPDFFLSGLNRWWSNIHPDDRAHWEQVMVKLKAGQPSVEEYRIVRPDGTVRWVRDSVMVSRGTSADAAARALKLDGVLTDITARKQAEEALRASEERLGGIVETIADGIIIVAPDRRITFANAAAEKVLGLPRSEITQRTYDDPGWKMTTVSGKPLPEEASAFVRVMLTGQPVYGVEQAIRRPDRSWVVVSINAAPMRDAGGPVVGMVASLNDITERKRAELAVQHRADEQEALSQVSRRLLHIESSRALFEELPPLLSKLFEFEMVAIEMVDERTGELVFLGSTGMAWRGPGPLRVPLGETLSQAVVQTGKALVTTQARQRPELTNPELRKLGCVTVACMPLSRGKAVIGTLVLASRQQKALASSLPITLQTIADLVAHTLERKRAEDALRSTNDTLRALIQASPLAIYVLDPAGQLRSWNAAAERMFGWTASEVLGQALTLAPPDKLSEVRSFGARVLQGESFTGVETRRQTKAGTLIEVSLSAAPLYDAQGQVNGVMAVAADITERKQAEQALREREWRLQTIVNSEPECLTIVSRDGRLLEMNPAGLAMIEAQDAAEVIGQPILNLVHPDDRASYQELHDAICQGKSSGTLRFRALGLRGGLRWMEMHAAPLRSHQGQIVSVLSVTLDITERMRAEDALRSSEVRFRALVENGSDAIALLDVSATIVYASPSTTRILGYPVQEFVGRKLFDLMHSDDLKRVGAVFADCLARPDKDLAAEFRYRHKNGSWRFIEAVSQNRLGDPSVQAVVVNYRDITERKRADAELSHERDLLHTLMQNIPDLIFFKDAAGRFTRINQAQARYLRVDHPEDAVGKSDFNYFPEPVAQEFYSDERRIVRTSKPLINKMERHLGEDGSERWTLTTKVPILGPDGRVTGIVGLSRDVTERKRAEEALRVSETRYRLLFERNLAGVFRATLDGRILDCNDSFARILGHDSRDEVLAQESGDYYYNEEDRSAFISLVKQRHTLMNFENCLRRKDGSPVWVLENVSLLAEDGQEVLEGTVFDITERKRAEEALTQERALLRSLIDSIPDLIFYKNREGHYLGCNAAFEEYTGRKERELIDLTDQGLFPRELGLLYRETDRKVLADSQPRRSEEWLGYPDGRRVLVETLRTPFFGPDGRTLGLIGISRDITERKHLENQLRQAQKMEAVGQLAGGVAHDFNNLLTAILGNVSLLMTTVPSHDPNRDLLAATEKAGLRAAELTRQLLGFSRQTMLRLEPLNLATSVEETIGILGRTIDPRIQVEVRLAANLWTVQADPGQISQVLLNLCLNARDAMPSGGRLVLESDNIVLGEDYAHLNLEALPGEFVRLRVSDTGHGIPAEIRSRIFDPFFTTKGPGKGTGLGLAMVFGIVKQHHGWIDCYSEVNQGTRFDIYLPRSRETLAPLPPPSAAPAPGGGKETILLADDEAIIRNLGRTILQRHGYKVLLAEDGRQAIELYQREKEHIDLVILDLTMPNVSGRDAFRQLLQIDPAVRVLFASGYSAEHLSDFERDGVLGFITKPYRPQDLVNQVRTVLDKAQAGVDR